MPTIWTKEELQYLYKNAYKGSVCIAEHLQRTRSQVVMKAYVERISLRRLGTNGRPFNENLIVDTKRSRKGTQLQPVKIFVFSEASLTKYPSAMHVNQRLWMKRRAIILHLHDYSCYYCGDLANTVDHIMPRHKGGDDQINNLVAACADCNFGWIQHIPWRDKYLRRKIQGV